MINYIINSYSVIYSIAGNKSITSYDITCSDKDIKPFYKLN